MNKTNAKSIKIISSIQQIRIVKTKLTLISIKSVLFEFLPFKQSPFNFQMEKRNWKTTALENLIDPTNRKQAKIKILFKVLLFEKERNLIV